jgi:Mn-dependent DtxR family transcriptional regulator
VSDQDKQEEPEQLPLSFELDQRFVKVMSHWLQDGTAAKMGGNAFMVLCFIRSFVGSRGSTATPAQSTIAKHLKLNVKTVRGALNKLEELGFVRTEQVFKKGKTHNAYFLVELELYKSKQPEVHGDAVLAVPFGQGERKKYETQLQYFERTGKLPPNSMIKVVNNITINAPILLGDNARVEINNVKVEAQKIQSGKSLASKASQRFYWELAERAVQRNAERLEKELREEFEQAVVAVKNLEENNKKESEPAQAELLLPESPPNQNL